jgi:hypothetical protein
MQSIGWSDFVRYNQENAPLKQLRPTKCVQFVRYNRVRYNRVSLYITNTNIDIEA